MMCWKFSETRLRAAPKGLVVTSGVYSRFSQSKLCIAFSGEQSCLRGVVHGDHCDFRVALSFPSSRASRTERCSPRHNKRLTLQVLHRMQECGLDYAAIFGVCMMQGCRLQRLPPRLALASFLTARYRCDDPRDLFPSSCELSPVLGTAS